MSEIVKLPQCIPKFAKDAIRLFAKNVKNTASDGLRHAARRVLRRLVATDITRFYPSCFHALEGLPVTLTIFEDVTVSFKLHFTERYHNKRMKALDALAELPTEK